MINNKFVVSDKEKPLFYGTFTDDVSTIGGFANWVQDGEYRECPELYIEICPDCKIITMFHQQT